MEYLRVRNWERFQHYKNRNPPWIKFHVSVLNDRDFMSLSFASQGLLAMLWVLASESHDGTVIGDPDELSFRLRKRVTVKDLEPLIGKFLDITCLQRASNTLADASNRQAVAVPETETEGEGEKERESFPTPNPSPSKKPPTPEDLLQTWNENRGDMRECKSLNSDRRRAARTRLAERPDLDRWAEVIRRAAKSNHCRGLTPPRDEGGKPWVAHFEWLVRPNSFARIEEGWYDNDRQTGRIEEGKRRLAEMVAKQQRSLSGASDGKPSTTTSPVHRDGNGNERGGPVD